MLVSKHGFLSLSDWLALLSVPPTDLNWLSEARKRLRDLCVRVCERDHSTRIYGRFSFHWEHLCSSPYTLASSAVTPFYQRPRDNSLKCLVLVWHSIQTPLTPQRIRVCKKDSERVHSHFRAYRKWDALSWLLGLGFYLTLEVMQTWKTDCYWYHSLFKWTLLTNQILKKNKPGIILQSFLLATTPIKRLPPKSYRCEEKSDADLLVVFMKSHIHPEGGMNVRTVTATHWDISHRTREELKKPHHTFHTRGVLSNWRSLFEHVHEQKRFKVERLRWIIHGL